jgi:hypothetical protein
VPPSPRSWQLCFSEPESPKVRKNPHSLQTSSDSGSWPLLVKSRAWEPQRREWRNFPSVTARFSLPSCGQGNVARPPNYPVSPKEAKSPDSSPPARKQQLWTHIRSVHTEPGGVARPEKIGFPIESNACRSIYRRLPGHRQLVKRTVFPGHWGLLRRGHSLELTHTPRQERLDAMCSECGLRELFAGCWRKLWAHWP